MNEKHKHASFTTLGGSKIDVLGVFAGISHGKLTSSERFDAVIELELKAICRAICAKNARHLCFKINMRFGMGRQNENVMCRRIEGKIRPLPA